MSNEHIEANWDYTDFMVEENEGHMFKGRPSIERDSQIDGGVYHGTYGGEAIVVDTEKYPNEYNKWLDIAKEKASVNGEIKKNHILKSTFDTVLEEMPYSKNGVDNLLSNIAAGRGESKFKDGTKVSLDYFMREHAGVCRHQALVVGTLLEMFKKEGYISGEVSVDRNTNWNPVTDEKGGHAWCRYTNSGGDIFILDVAQKYAGTLEDSKTEAQWNYLRPEEQEDKRQEVIPKKIGGNAMKNFFKNKFNVH